MTTKKKVLWISLISLDVAITLFLFIVSIIMLATMPDSLGMQKMKQEGAKNFIQWFQLNNIAYLCIGVIPLFLLLIGNGVGLYLYVKKNSAKKALQLNDLSAEEKEALRKELLNDLKNEEEKK